MTPTATDAELLSRYAKDGSEPAFAELVQRHINLVYAGALRRVGGDAHLANDITQQVFTAMARQAATLADRPVLAGWLHTTTRYQAAQVVRTERRRQKREQEAHVMNDPANPDPAVAADWQRLRPLLDEALDELGESDREAVLLRHLEGRSYAEVGAQLRLTENAARMRVERAMEKMPGLLARRGVTSTVGALAVALSGEAAVIAPAGLAAVVTGKVLAGTIVATGTAGGLGLMAFMNTKIVSGVAVLVAVVAGGVAVNQASENQALRNELLAARQAGDSALARLAKAERSLEEQKTALRTAEEDTASLLTAIDRARVASEAKAVGPLTAEMVQARFRKAQELVRVGNWEAALPELLWCYDEGMVRVTALQAVRLSFLLSEIARLAPKYPPALEALRERRDRIAKVVESTNDFGVAAELAALNQALGDNAATLALFDKLSPGDMRRQGMARVVFEQLRVDRRYKDAAAAVLFPEMASRFARSIQYTPPLPADNPRSAEIKLGFVKATVTTAAQNIEVLSGAGKLDEAHELVKQVLAYDSSNETKLIIRQHVTRAGHPELMP